MESAKRAAYRIVNEVLAEHAQGDGPSAVWAEQELQRRRAQAVTDSMRLLRQTFQAMVDGVRAWWESTPPMFKAMVQMQVEANCTDPNCDHPHPDQHWSQGADGWRYDDTCPDCDHIPVREVP